jgi:hypothetical protein
MLDPSVHCGNDLWKLADRAKNVIWLVVFRAHFLDLNGSFGGLYVKGAF